MTAVAQILQKDLLRINQSKIKRLTRNAICPQKYYLEEITGDLKRESSKQMAKGHYFEYKLWGTLPKEGNIPVAAPGKKKGSISVEYERIDEQVRKFPAIMAKHGIKVIKTNYYIEVLVEVNGLKIIFHGTKDALVEYKGRPYIFDLKYTGDVTSTFGDFAWGNFQTLIMAPDATGIYSHVQTIADGGKEMDLIQAHAYMYTMEQYTKRRWGFLYGVFDGKAKGPEHKIIEVPYSEPDRQDMLHRLGDTKHKLDLFQELKYAPIPSEHECKGCKVLNCDSRMTFDDDPVDNTTALLTKSVQVLTVNNDPDCPW